jgi:tetratricopeptide (TPR) repeat protein
VARGEVALGMTEAQVMAATRTAPAAWTVRRAAAAATMTPAALSAPPADVVSEVALVQLADGRVRSVSYREPQGLRVVERPEDQTPTGRARATADALIREGDQFAAAGDRAAALDRFDRALVLAPNDALLQYRVATLLDLQLRPFEALIRYQRFLQTLELQRIEAVGNANAKLAEAIARAQQRIIVLERQSR